MSEVACQGAERPIEEKKQRGIEGWKKEKQRAYRAPAACLKYNWTTPGTGMIDVFKDFNVQVGWLSF